MNLGTKYSHKVEIVNACIIKTLQKEMTNSEKEVLEGILKTQGNVFSYEEVVMANFPKLNDKEQIDKFKDNYKSYFNNKLKTTLQEFFETHPNLKCFKIKVGKENFKRILDAYIFDSDAIDLLNLRVENIMHMIYDLDTLEISIKTQSELELFRLKIEEAIKILNELLMKITRKK